MTKSKPAEKLLKEIHATHARLDALFQRDPPAAVREARALLQSTELDATNRQMLAAGILIDAGNVAHDIAAVEEGTALYRALRQRHPSHGIDYNYANGLSTLAGLSKEPPWSQPLSAKRREARILFAQTAASDEALRSQALTNEANLLRQSFRRLEAYDAFVAALQADPRNGVASSGIARVLLELVDHGLGPKILCGLANRYLGEAADAEDEIVKYAGEHALKNIRALTSRSTAPPVAKQKTPSGYAGFVATHRLALSLSMELFDPSKQFWDDLKFHSIIEPIVGTGAEIPAVFGMWNVLKADFIAARWLAYTATEEFQETGNYHDTLDYANYGTVQSMAVLAQRAAMDVLDKVAGFATEYLKLPGKPKQVYFHNRWHRDRKDKTMPLVWQSEILKELGEGNPGLLALGDLASDLLSDGPLNARTLLRHSGTHRFVILHDMLGSSRASEFVEHYKQAEFKGTTIATLQMCRAALTYARELVIWRERRLAARDPDAKRFQLQVPPHHQIRGC